MRIKKFNEEIYLKGGEDENGNPHHYTQTTDKISQWDLRPELKEFFINFVNNLVNIKDSLEKNKHLSKIDKDCIEKLYSSYKSQKSAAPYYNPKDKDGKVDKDYIDWMNRDSLNT